MWFHIKSDVWGLWRGILIDPLESGMVRSSALLPAQSHAAMPRPHAPEPHCLLEETITFGHRLKVPDTPHMAQQKPVFSLAKDLVFVCETL